MDFLPFVGREKELAILKRYLNKKTASILVVKGRRRIGKSRLIETFAEGHRFLEFTGLAPIKKTTAQDQRDEFASQMSKYGFPKVTAHDWNDLFWLLAEKVQKGRLILLFDEISWMGSLDPNFLSKLKAFWDVHLKKNSELILILCGSVSIWIEENLISSTGYFGRISRKLALRELPLVDCSRLLDSLGFCRSPMEKLLLLGIMGGVPWYLEHVDPSVSAIENIKRLCFEPNALLVDEYDSIFHDLFKSRSAICKRIVEFLVQGPAEYHDIASNVNFPSGGTLSEYLNELVISGYIERDYTWNLPTGIKSKLSHYRLSDNYLRFYLKYIVPNLEKIEGGQFEDANITLFPGWNSVMGLQFENLILNNKKLIFSCLGISPEDILHQNPFFQRKTTKQPGCQIDLLIETRQHTLFACEIKFSHHPISSSLIKEMKEKHSRLKIPKGYACLPVLIHMSGVTDALRDIDYFYKIIDIRDFL